MFQFEYSNIFQMGSSIVIHGVDFLLVGTVEVLMTDRFFNGISFKNWWFQAGWESVSGLSFRSCPLYETFEWSNWNGHIWVTLKIVDLVFLHPDDPETPKAKDGRKWRNDHPLVLKSSLNLLNHPIIVGWLGRLFWGCFLRWSTSSDLGWTFGSFSIQGIGRRFQNERLKLVKSDIPPLDSRHFLRVSRARSQLQVRDMETGKGGFFSVDKGGFWECILWPRILHRWNPKIELVYYWFFL